MNDSEQQRRVRYERLHEAGVQPLHVRIFARVFCHALVSGFHLVTSFFRGLRGSRPGVRRGQGARIVVTGTFFADNWVEAYVRPLALSACSEHVWVVADHPFVPMKNVTYVCPPCWLQKLIGRVPARSVVFAITAALRRADVVGGFHLLCNGLLALMVARMVGARAMYFCVGGPMEVLDGGIWAENRIFGKIEMPDPVIERRLIRAVADFDLILTMGTGARTFLLRRGVTAPIEIMPGAIDSQIYSPMNRKRKKYDLVTVSRIAPVKRLDVFLDVVRRVADSVPTVTAAIVGDGEQLGSLKQRAATLGLSDRVAFVGRQKNVPRWLADSRLFVLTSDSEGLSIALMEAMMAGLPAVVSDVGDLRDLVTNGVNGWRVQRRHVKGFAERIVELLLDDEYYRSFSKNARRAAVRYSVGPMSCRWGDILKRLGCVPPTDHDSATPPR